MMRFALAALLILGISAAPAIAQDQTGDDNAASDLHSPPAIPTREKFRWPLRGRIVLAFKKGGTDGIEIAAPVGEPVHAAGDGIVTYAGDELQTYGKLILIRHDNDFVSAYADNSELSVAAGDRVKRGQIIAKSGQPNSGGAPRLHFELRKGGAPVDPVKFLAPM